MLPAILAVLLTVTPAECKADYEWCMCRRYIAKELNKCQVAAEKNSGVGNQAYTAKLLAGCIVTYEKGKIACLKNDGDLYP
jgi:hypothetical protein